MVNFHNTRQMVQVNVNLTITDDDTDIVLNPDGSFPTKEDIAADARTNTRTHVVRNPDTGVWQRITTRHAPFGMPLSQQQGDRWWLAAPNPRLVALENQADADLRRSIDNVRLRVQHEQARHAVTQAVDNMWRMIARENRRRMILQYLRNEVQMAWLRGQMAIVQEEIIRGRAARAARAGLQAAPEGSQDGGDDDDSSVEDSSFDDSSLDDSSDDGSSVDDNSTDASSFDGQEL